MKVKVIAIIERVPRNQRVQEPLIKLLKVSFGFIERQGVFHDVRVRNFSLINTIPFLIFEFLDNFLLSNAFIFSLAGISHLNEILLVKHHEESLSRVE